MRRAILAALIGAVAGGLLTYWLFPRVEVRTEVRVDTVRTADTVRLVRMDTVDRVPEGLMRDLRSVLPSGHHPSYRRLIERWVRTPPRPDPGQP